VSSDADTLQLRGDRGAYERYLAAMDKSMQQKVALTAAYLLCQGRVADMGMGSGAGSAALAGLYPGLDVVGVDLSPQMVELATAHHQAANLSFVVGDISAPVFEPESLDGIFDSSVLHHVTSFGGYRRDAAADTLGTQVGQLRPHGVVIVRDFLDPGPGEVLVDVPADDGDDSDDPLACSTAALLERFAREFRSLHASPGFPLHRVDPDDTTPQGWRRYRMARVHAVEFVLRKDYREDWEAEVKEEYTYATQSEFEAMFSRHGLRVLASTPIRNPWIVRNRFRGKFAWQDTDGRSLDDPATNYVIVGERVPPGTGVRFEEGVDRPPLGFLTLSHYRHRVTGKVRDLIARPHLTVDALPWFLHDDDVFVLGRMSYPRPILVAGGRPDSSGSATGAIDGSRTAGFATEPLTVIQTDAPLGQTIEDALRDRAGIASDRIRRFREGGRYFPSPGGLREEIRSLHVELDPVFGGHDVPPSSGWSTSGRIAAMECRQLLRAAQVGGLPDARLELNVYELLQTLGRDPGPWIGDAISPSEGPRPRSHSIEALASISPRRRYSLAAPESSANFLDLRCRTFRELDAEGKILHERTLEYVVPRELSLHTVAVALLRRHGDEVYIGLDDDDLPAAQGILGNSNLLVAPAWRLPATIDTMHAAQAWLGEHLLTEYALQVGEVWPLGGRYHPSAGATPEVVHPLAVDVIGERGGGRPLLWAPLRPLLREPWLLLDGHLRILAWRSAHALGLLTAGK
jgi:SAM-dependent methyltransferase